MWNCIKDDDVSHPTTCRVMSPLVIILHPTEEKNLFHSIPDMAFNRSVHEWDMVQWVGTQMSYDLSPLKRNMFNGYVRLCVCMWVRPEYLSWGNGKIVATLKIRSVINSSTSVNSEYLYVQTTWVFFSWKYI